MPGRGSQAEKDAEKFGAQAGAKMDQFVSFLAHLTQFTPLNREIDRESRRLTLYQSQQSSKAQADAAKLKADAEAYGKDLKQDALKKVDEFDRKVETKTAEAKSGISSWFGGSK